MTEKEVDDMFKPSPLTWLIAFTISLVFWSGIVYLALQA